MVMRKLASHVQKNKVGSPTINEMQTLKWIKLLNGNYSYRLQALFWGQYSKIDCGYGCTTL